MRRRDNDEVLQSERQCATTLTASVKARPPDAPPCKSRGCVNGTLYSNACDRGTTAAADSMAAPHVSHAAAQTPPHGEHDE